MQLVLEIMSLSPLLQLLESAQRSPESSLIVFDLDSTLFDVSPRLQKIIDDFASSSENKMKFPNEVKRLEFARTESRDWGVKNALERAGIHSASDAFHAAMKSHWLSCFFSNEYLDHDSPSVGAVEFVTKLQSLGLAVSYLTGRDEPRMGQGSRKILRKWGFPLGPTAEELILKPQKNLEDADFKVEELKKLLKKGHSPIWLIDNEPIIINSVLKNLPEVNVIFFDSTHAGKEEVPLNLPRISHFRI